MLRQLLPAIRATLVLAVLTGLLYPLGITAAAQVLFSHQANGSLIRAADGKVIGSRLLAQGFTKPEYFHPCLSAAGSGYDGTSSGGTNLYPTNDKLIHGVHKSLANGKDDPESTVLLSNLADAYTNQRRYAEAEKLLKRSIVITVKAFGPDHADVAQGLNNLAALYARQGRNAEAERFFKQSVATFEKTLGPNHPELAGVLDNLAGLYKDQGRYADARELYKRSAAIRGKAGTAS